MRASSRGSFPPYTSGTTLELSDLGARAEDLAASLRRGEPVSLIEGGKPLGRFTPEPTPEERYAEAVRAGTITPPTSPDALHRFLRRPSPKFGGKPLLDHLLEAREEEYGEDECGHQLAHASVRAETTSA